MKSCIYEGKVRHRRNSPTHHQFDFSTFMLMIDLDELKSVFAKRWLWSTEAMAPIRLRQTDRLKSHGHIVELRDRVAAVLADHGITEPLGSVRLLTQLRYLGFEMNPVCFYYCYSEHLNEPSNSEGNTQSDDSDQQVIAIIAEVNNTPWGEQHNYVVEAVPQGSRFDKRHTESQKNIKSDPIEKAFHVSPFLGMNMDYRMAFSIPNQRLGIKIENHLFEDPSADPAASESSGQRANCGNKILDVAMLMERRPLTGANLSWMLIKYPLISFRTFAGIYWQALRLYLKGVPFFPHPKNTSKSDLASGESEETDNKPKTSNSALVGQ